MISSKTRILCYGDSNTHGYNPMTGGRYGEDARWPMVAQTALGDGYRVIEEGLNGRTFSFDDTVEGGQRNGATYLPACLVSHNPIDLFAVMLGTNDAKERFCMNAGTIACNLTNYVKIVREYAFDHDGKPTKILIISPPLIGNIEKSPFADHFGISSIEKAKGFAQHYRRYARLLGCEFMDAAQYANPCKVDAIHLTPDGQMALGNAVADKVRSIFA